jgi:methionine-rich copper-binding protein CopC
VRRWLLPLLLAALATFGLAGPAAAHNVLETSQPAEGAKLATGPKTIVLHFDQEVQQGPNKITVIGPDGKQWQANKGDATVTGSDMRNNVRPLGPAGRYTIGYHVISADGHPLNGSRTFTLTKAGNGTPNPNAAAVSTSDSSGSGEVPVWVWIGGAVVLLGVGLVVALRAGRES